MALPAQYTACFTSDAPKEGALTVEPGWFQLWLPAEVEQFNRDDHVSEFAPGFLGFGSSGGGEFFTFDSEGRVVMIPMPGVMTHKTSRTPLRIPRVAANPFPLNL